MLALMENVAQINETKETKAFPNGGRQLGIDLAKCLAILFMVGIHCLMEFGVDSNTTFYKMYDLIFGGILAAPVFMTAMGVGLSYSRKARPRDFVFRGINILVLAYLLNVVRVLPKFIISGINGDLDLLYDAVYIDVLGADILTFAGLALILFGLLRALKLKDYMVLGIGILCALLATFIPTVETDNMILNCFTGLFTATIWQGEITMAFPLLSWFVFPCFGYFYGNHLKNSHNVNRFHIIAGSVGAVIAIVGFNLGRHFDFGFTSTTGNIDLAFYGMKAYDSFFCLGAGVAFFALCHFIALISPKGLQKGYVTMSNALNLIYIIHWPCILYISLPLTYNGINQPLWGAILIAIGIAIFATTTGILLKGHIKKKMAENPYTLWRYVNAG